MLSEFPILITGAGRNVGFYLAKTLHEQGYPIIAHFHSDNDNIRTLQALNIPTLSCDFSQTGQIRSFCENLRERYSQLRAIIHNASVFSTTATDLEQACQQWGQFHALHVQAPFIINTLLQSCLLSDTDELRDIIHITDIYAENPNPDFDLYCASKAALENLSKSFAKKFAPGIKVNTIQPGPISFQPWHSEKARQKVIEQTLLKRLGGEKAIAQGVLAILSNAYMTGTALKIDGGRYIAQY